MIVDSAPRVRIIVLEVWKPLAVLFLWDCAVTAFYFLLSPFDAPDLPITLFGTAVALFLGFRSNSAYQRWWEGRVLWGAMINASRSLARIAINYLPRDRQAARDIVMRQIAYVHTLRHSLRRETPDADLVRLLPADEAAAAMARKNPANALLDDIGARIAQARAEGRIDTILQAQFERVLIDIANAQGGMERLKNTPLPMQYRFLPAFFARLFCMLLPFALVDTLGFATPVGSTVAGLMFLAALQIGDDLVDPFANNVHDVPLSAMCRTIEIDLLQAIGDQAPAPLAPEKGVLW